MNFFEEFLGKNIVIEITGSRHEGLLVDFGKDIAVLDDGHYFLYIPLSHVKNIRLNVINNNFQSSLATPIASIGSLSYMDILEKAKELFVELSVVNNQSVHGYITKLLADYFIFYSPIYNTLLIPYEHVKFLSLGNSNQTYFSLSKQDVLAVDSKLESIFPNFNQQIASLAGKLVVFDLGNAAHKIGMLKEYKNNFIRLINATEEEIYINIEHVQIVQIPLR